MLLVIPKDLKLMKPIKSGNLNRKPWLIDHTHDNYIKFIRWFYLILLIKFQFAILFNCYKAFNYLVNNNNSNPNQIQMAFMRNLILGTLMFVISIEISYLAGWLGSLLDYLQNNWQIMLIPIVAVATLMGIYLCWSSITESSEYDEDLTYSKS